MVFIVAILFWLRSVPQYVIWLLWQFGNYGQDGGFQVSLEQKHTIILGEIASDAVTRPWDAVLVSIVMDETKLRAHIDSSLLKLAVIYTLLTVVHECRPATQEV